MSSNSNHSTAATQTDVVVVGAGVAGYVCAIRLSQLGKKVTIIDKAELGGVCLNRGCIPSKALIHAGGLFEKIGHASEIGIDVGQPKMNFPKLMEWKNSVVKKLTQGVAGLLKANGCTVISGEATFLSTKELEVVTSGKKQIIQFQDAVIATGSRPTSIPGVEVDQKQILDSTGALSLTHSPKSMLCIGGGYIGLELGSFYSKTGTAVTVVEAMGGLLGGVDPDLARVVAKKLEKKGVKVHLNTKVKKVTSKGKQVSVTFQGSDGKTFEEQFETVLVTVGRKPNTEGLGLDRLGIQPNSYGFIDVNSKRQTAIANIYAIGDVAGQPLLAHKGSKEGLVAAEVIAGQKTQYDVVAMPAVIFTDPEIAAVGMTEAEAKEKGIETTVGQFPFAANGRALSVNEPDGFVKIVGDKKTGRLLGVHIVGVEASNLISEAALALEMGAQVEDLALTVHPHPTLGETLMEASEAALGHAVHIFQRKVTSKESPQASL